jgi:hypothetical protein
MVSIEEKLIIIKLAHADNAIILLNIIAILDVFKCGFKLAFDHKTPPRKLRIIEL